ncbi:MAG: transglycosylase domain-containing protein, partial [Pseudomonadales bacterium]|nr:transglycosylase domain-containing protein [Pseudomonadales bacterium]
QVAKNFFLSREKTFIRKFNEILLALQIERELDKSEILALYINKIYLGHRSYGIAAAARVYYGLDISELELPQLAMIAGLPKAPSRYNPITNATRALARRNWILQRMLNLDYIDLLTYQHAVKAPVIAEYHGLRPEVEASYLAEMARKEMLDRFGKQAYTGGYSVVTTVHSKLQEYANRAVQNGLQSYDKRHGYRGPESRIESPSPEEATPRLTEEWLATLQGKLKKYPVIGSLLPAVITSVEDERATAIIKRSNAKRFTPNNQTEITLTLESIKWARPYISVNQKGPKPKLMSDTVAVGDVIRVKPSYYESDNISWVMGQLPEAQAALIALSPENGAIQAIVGGFDFHQSKFNRVLQAGRQAGSNFKPFIYTAALANGFTAASIINDAPVVFNDKSLESTWRPENSSGRFFGPTRLR